MRTTDGRGLVLLALVLGLTGGCEGCFKQRPVESVEELPYPTCPGESSGEEEEVLLEGAFRSGPYHREPNIVERWSFTKRGCHHVLRSRQEWPQGTSDIEVVYDEALHPLRAWKRTTSPAFDNPEERADIRRYEMRTDPVTLKVRESDGGVRFAHLVGPRPTAAVGPGRALLVPWIRRLDLAVGETSREPVLDFRSLGLERVESITLRRDPDRHEPTMGRTVQVYTVYGRESVFVDQRGAVIGDLAGLRPLELVDEPMPPPIPLYGEPDPVHTP